MTVTRHWLWWCAVVASTDSVVPHTLTHFMIDANAYSYIIVEKHTSIQQYIGYIWSQCFENNNINHNNNFWLILWENNNYARTIIFNNRILIKWNPIFYGGFYLYWYGVRMVLLCSVASHEGVFILFSHKNESYHQRFNEFSVWKPEKAKFSCDTYRSSSSLTQLHSQFSICSLQFSYPTRISRILTQK